MKDYVSSNRHWIFRILPRRDGPHAYLLLMTFYLSLL
ncbi:hypothetical protein EMIT0158MI4_200122 [Burkholderia ambifaria]